MWSLVETIHGTWFCGHLRSNSACPLSPLFISLLASGIRTLLSLFFPLIDCTEVPSPPPSSFYKLGFARTHSSASLALQPPPPPSGSTPHTHFFVFTLWVWGVERLPLQSRTGAAAAKPLVRARRGELGHATNVPPKALFSGTRGQSRPGDPASSSAPGAPRAAVPHSTAQSLEA